MKLRMKGGNSKPGLKGQVPLYYLNLRGDIRDFGYNRTNSQGKGPRGLLLASDFRNL